MLKAGKTEIHMTIFFFYYYYLFIYLYSFKNFQNTGIENYCNNLPYFWHLLILEGFQYQSHQPDLETYYLKVK